VPTLQVSLEAYREYRFTLCQYGGLACWDSLDTLSWLACTQVAYNDDYPTAASDRKSCTYQLSGRYYYGCEFGDNEPLTYTLAYDQEAHCNPCRVAISPRDADASYPTEAEPSDHRGCRSTALI